MHTLEFVKQFFKDENCELLEDEYVNNYTKMKYRCSCGNISYIVFKNFRKGQRCAECGGTKKHTFKYVDKCFKDGGCILLEKKYINGKVKMKYICICGKESEICFNHFKNGVRCMECGGSKKLTIEFAKQFFKNNDCTLLETEYINCKTKMKYICSCENKSEITFDSFKRGQRCVKCGGTEKHTFEFVEQYFEDRGCILLEKEYINNHAKMRYICSCGRESEITFANFKKGRRCAKCGGTEKHTIEYVKQFFKENNCELLETEYINANTKMRYKCSCGNKSEIRFSHFLQGHRCKDCTSKRTGEKLKLTYEFVSQCFLDNGCILLETEYINSLTKMRYICICGEKSKITFSSFQQGSRCIKCGIKKISGKNHYNYNPYLTDKEREINKNRRSDPRYSGWIKDIYRKYNYTCQKCEETKYSNGKYKRLNSHHIESWNNNKELRFVTDNGITFCVDCHHDFHKKYGYGYNTKEQVEEFLKMDICQK